jgi:hypothetical protein
MKRYLIFAALGPLFGGFLLLFATTVMGGFWVKPFLPELAKLLVVFAKTLQYSYLFGVVPALMIGALDDILFHVRRLNWIIRALIVSAVAFFAAALLYGSRGSDSGVAQFFLYGMVGVVPAFISSVLAHKVETAAPVPAAG